MKNVHILDLGVGKVRKLAVLSDLHWDNPKCDREKLRSHLDYCVLNDIPVVVIGDFFCLMQGKGDPRASKSDVLPEHNNSKYLDSVIQTAVDWFIPYAGILKVIGYGNHETGVIKHRETDVLQRFVDLLNYKTGEKIEVGGYGGWIVCYMQYAKQDSSYRVSKTIKYFHGSGGGGPVTRGEINLTRAMAMHEGYDIYTMGHIHENKVTNTVREKLVYNAGKRLHELSHHSMHSMVTGTYKEEFAEGGKGWHVERGAAIKPTGGRIVTFTYRRKNTIREYLIDSILFPL
jgi:hypothetical protein